MSKPIFRLTPLLVLLCCIRPVVADDAVTPGKQQPQTFVGEVKIPVKLNYLLYLPKGYDPAGEKRWPLLLFLHGAGESGHDLNRVKIHGPPKLAEKKEFPFIVVSPQSPKFGWDVHGLNALLDDVSAKHKVDADRVYLTGLSMGGFGTFALATAYPQRFAALVPICGGGESIFAAKIKNIPIWVFHGAKDTAVPLKRSEEMVAALKKAGADVRFTVYENAGHDSWTETYNNPALYEWLLKQRREQKK
jgi:predicted peptidase